MKNEKGAALITTIILGLVAMAVIAALLTFIIYGKRTSTVERKYTSTLEAAKGAADYIMKGLLNTSLVCQNSSGDISCNCSDLSSDLKCPSCSNSGCPQATTINLGSYSTIGNYNITATILSKAETSSAVIYAIRVQAQKTSSSEKAVIEFVYKIE